ncbi:MAG: hypothetical protein SFY68_15105 [Candidatus Sumerlaeia bacterium]|nr:hypothetical protein [Candidatus Sumerlaeia bacterium]
MATEPRGTGADSRRNAAPPAGEDYDFPPPSKIPRNADLLFIVVVFIILVLVVVVTLDQVPEFLFNKYSGLIFIIMLVEYVILKSMDRTRVYERENARLREKLRNCRRVMQKAERLLEDSAKTDCETVDVRDRVKWEALAKDCAEDLRKNL